MIERKKDNILHRKPWCQRVSHHVVYQVFLHELDGNDSVQNKNILKIRLSKLHLFL